MARRPLIFIASMLALAPAMAQVRGDAPVNPFSGDAAAAAAGKVLFDSTCVICHGAAGAGGARAPALDTGRFTRGADDFSLYEIIRHGLQGTPMPAFAMLSRDDVWRLVTYLRSLPRAGGNSGMAAGDPKQGERLFFGSAGCAACHEINGRGGTQAADLSGVGQRDPAALEAGVKHELPPPQPWDVPPMSVAAVLDDGRHVRGRVKAEDGFTLVLQRRAGDFVSLDKLAIRSLETLPGEAFPTDVGRRLSSAQIGDLLAFLARQKRRDPGKTSRVRIEGGLAFGRLVNARQEPQNWLTYWGGYDAHHFSELRQISRSNVHTLQARWAVPLGGASPLEATPLVVDGVLYVSGYPGDVYAIDARSGLQLWKFHRQQRVTSPFQINPYNRGVAVLGNRVFVGTLDDALLALDARTGRPLWERKLADTMAGYTLTGAPLALGHAVIVGVSGGEQGIRGFIEAYDPADGRRLWRFDTIPGPGEPGHESWSGDSWKTGSGATWLTGSYDPQLNQLYWTVGNPGPDFNPVSRQGDNLYTCSVLALDPATGHLLWHYQFSPHDTHDWDSEEDLILADKVVAGTRRKVLLHADRNGFLYTLDRTNGKFLSATAFVRQTWNKGFGPEGRPVVDPASVATEEGHPIFPAVGGTNFQAPSFDEASGRLFLAYEDSQGFSSYGPVRYQPGRPFYGAGIRVNGNAPAPASVQGIMALDPDTGKPLWTHALGRASLQAGVLATRGGVVFAATGESNLIALDADSGQSLWHFQTGATMLASPVSYAVDGRQYVAVVAGNMLYSFALPDPEEGPR